MHKIKYEWYVLQYAICAWIPIASMNSFFVSLGFVRIPENNNLTSAEISMLLLGRYNDDIK